jgi:hypothetical protein
VQSKNTVSHPKRRKFESVLKENCWAQYFKLTERKPLEDQLKNPYILSID